MSLLGVDPGFTSFCLESQFGRCYGLNVCTSLKFVCLSPNPHCDRSWTWRLCKVFRIDQGDGALMNGDQCSSKKRYLKCVLPFFLPCEDTARRWQYASQDGSFHPIMLVSWFQISSLQNSEKFNKVCGTLLKQPQRSWNSTTMWTGLHIQNWKHSDFRRGQQSRPRGYLQLLSKLPKYLFEI